MTDNNIEAYKREITHQNLEHEIFYNLAVLQFQGKTMDDSGQAVKTIADRYKLPVNDIYRILATGSFAGWPIPEYPDKDCEWNKS